MTDGPRELVSSSHTQAPSRPNARSKWWVLGIAVAAAILLVVAYQAGLVLLRFGYPRSHPSIVRAVDPARGLELFHGDRFHDLSAFTLVGTAPTLDAEGHLVLNSTSPSVTGQQIILNAPLTTTNSEQWDFEVTYQVNAPGAGLAIARKSINPDVSLGFFAIVDTRAQEIKAGNLSKDDLYYARGAKQKVTNPKMGDVVKLTLTQRGPRYEIHVANLTSGENAELSLEDSQLDGHPFTMTNTSQFALLNMGGSYKIRDLQVTERSAPTPTLCIVGDSKTQGTGAGGYDLRWASLLDGYGSVAVFSGGGDKTAEVLAAMPFLRAKHCRNVILEIGYNDLGFHAPTATWQSNFTSIFSQFKADGTQVFPMLAIPTLSRADPTAMNAFLKSNTGLKWIDPAIGFNTHSMLYRDRIHVNPLGNLRIAKNVVKQLPITPSVDLSVDVLFLRRLL